MTTLYMTRGDFKPSIEVTLKCLDGTTVDLTDSSGVVFNMKKENGQVIISGKAGSIIDGSAPRLNPALFATIGKRTTLMLLGLLWRVCGNF